MIKEKRYNKMTKEKARKHLAMAQEHLLSWRVQYVKAKRENAPNCILNEIIEEINYSKGRIARLQRLAI